jgi:hypothetical protein
MFRPLIYGHHRVLVQSSLKKRILYLLGLGGGQNLTLQIMGIVVWYLVSWVFFLGLVGCGVSMRCSSPSCEVLRLGGLPARL